ncbi:MAG: Hsp20/alpha crystallin family protein [Planctomycetaceae bacterium]
MSQSERPPQADGCEPSSHESRPERPLTASVEKLRRELDHWLDVAWSQGERALDAFGLKSSPTWTPAVDLIETPDEVRVVVDVPGVDSHKVEITLAGNMLTLKGERLPILNRDQQQIHLRQRHSGTFVRSIPLPAPVDAEKVSAETENGVLTIRLTKSERAKPRQIPIETRRPSV